MQKMRRLLWLEASDLMGYTGIKKVSRIVSSVNPANFAGRFPLIVFMRAFSDSRDPHAHRRRMYRTRTSSLLFNEFISWKWEGMTGSRAANQYYGWLFLRLSYFSFKNMSPHQKSFAMSALNPIPEVMRSKRAWWTLLGPWLCFFTIFTGDSPCCAQTGHVRLYSHFKKLQAGFLLRGILFKAYATAFRRVGSSTRWTRFFSCRDINYDSMFSWP